MATCVMRCILPKSPSRVKTKQNFEAREIKENKSKICRSMSPNISYPIMFYFIESRWPRSNLVFESIPGPVKLTNIPVYVFTLFPFGFCFPEASRPNLPWWLSINIMVSMNWLWGLFVETYTIYFIAFGTLCRPGFLAFMGDLGKRTKQKKPNVGINVPYVPLVSFVQSW